MNLVDDSLYYLDTTQTKDYFYFLKLVPHIFVDEYDQENYHSYSYSLNHNSKVFYYIHYLQHLNLTHYIAIINGFLANDNYDL